MATISGTWCISAITGAGMLPSQNVQFISNGVEFSSISTESVTDVKVTTVSLYYDDTMVGFCIPPGDITWGTLSSSYITFIGTQTVSSSFYSLFTSYATQTSTDIYEPTSSGGGAYIGVGGVAKKCKNIYVGVNGVARKVKKAYIGVDGVAKLWWSDGATTITFFITSGGITNECTAENGMTWAEWIESDYCTLHSPSINSDGTITCLAGRVSLITPNSATWVYVDSGDIIINGASYSTAS